MLSLLARWGTRCHASGMFVVTEAEAEADAICAIFDEERELAAVLEFR